MDDVAYVRLEYRYKGVGGVGGSGLMSGWSGAATAPSFRLPQQQLMHRPAGVTIQRTLSTPMPNAMVATTTRTAPVRQSFCTAVRCLGVMPA